MKRSNRLVLLVGVFLAVLAFVGVLVLSQGTTRTEDDELTTKDVVVAAEDIPLGTVIETGMLEIKTVPLEGAEADAFLDVSQVVGEIAREEVIAGAQITQRTISSGVGRVLNLRVEPGYRAMAVQVDQVTGVGTLIKQGDYVDMVIRMEVEPISINPGNGLFPPDAGLILQEEGGEVGEGGGVTPTTTKLILQGMQVIGTLLPPQAPAAADGGASPQPGTALTNQNEIVILALTPAQTEVVKWAQSDAVSISLVLRSPADFVDADGNPLTAESPCTTVRPSPSPAASPSPSPAASEVPETPFPCEVTDGVVLSTLIEEYGVLVNNSLLTVGVGDLPDELVFPSLNPDLLELQP